MLYLYYQAELKNYYSQVKSKNEEGWATQAGVGIGVYYDGHNGYAEEWTEDNAKEFLAEIVKQGGQAIDIFRLCKNTGWTTGRELTGGPH